MRNEDTEIHFLVDASIYIFQAHFSPNVECRSLDGEDLSAVFGFTAFLVQFLRRVKPTSIAVAMDNSLFSGFRHGLSSSYKSNRELPDENLAMQLAGCSAISKALGLCTHGSRVYEADDIIGTLATDIRSLSSAETAIHIVSKDKDLAQLLQGEYDCIWDISGNRRRFAPDISAEFGVSPAQFRDYLALVGDSVDCISGVPGMGPVKAKALLSRYDSLESIYENLDRLSELPVRGAGGLAKLLRENREAAFLSRRLATIATRVTDEQETFSGLGLQALQPKEADLALVSQLLQELRFTPAVEDRLLSQARAMLSALGANR